MLDEDVTARLDLLHVTAPRNLRRYLGERAFLAAIAAQPHQPRGVMEVDLSLAHRLVDLLLGGVGDAPVLRPLTDLEEGVLMYLAVELLRTLHQSAPGELPHFRLEGVHQNPGEVLALLEDELSVVVAQIAVAVGQHAGTVRFVLPGTVVQAAAFDRASARQVKERELQVEEHRHRFSHIPTFVRVEVGQVTLTGHELRDLGPRDVIVVDEVLARPDRGEGGKVRLRVGKGIVGYLVAQLNVEETRYELVLTGLEVHGALKGASGRKAVEEAEKALETADLLGDVPLHISVELGRVPTTAEEILGVKLGDVIDLRRAAGDPVDLSVNGKIIARGELVEVDGNLGVRITSMVRT